MKKYFYFLLVAVLPLAIVSCSDDEDDDFILQNSSVEITNGQTGQIQFTGSIPNIKVSNTFIATVDGKGKVTAKHAGHTIAYIGNKTVDIYVKGTNPLIGDVCYEWGKGKQYVFSKTTLSDFQKANNTSTDQYVGWKAYNNQAIVVLTYGFTKNQDKLEMAMILVHKSFSSNLAAFLKERFYMVDYTNVLGNLLVGAGGLDSDDPDTATSIVTLVENADYPNYYAVMIMPYSKK